MSDNKVMVTREFNVTVRTFTAVRFRNEHDRTLAGEILAPDVELWDDNGLSVLVARATGQVKEQQASYKLLGLHQDCEWGTQVQVSKFLRHGVEMEWGPTVCNLDGATARSINNGYKGRER